jgi:hypothetical protein
VYHSSCRVLLPAQVLMTMMTTAGAAVITAAVMDRSAITGATEITLIREDGAAMAPAGVMMIVMIVMIAMGRPGDGVVVQWEVSSE